MEQSGAIEQKLIVILGGSYSGISIAHHVLKHTIASVPDSERYQLILISNSSQAMCRPACPRAMIADSMFDQSKLFVDIPDQFQGYSQGFRFIHGTATDLDVTERTVSVRGHDDSERSIKFYALVIATGATATSPLHGFQGDASDLRNSWVTFRRALVNAQSIVIAGGGPTGVETAGELGEYLNGWNRKDRKVAITLISSGRILPQLRSALSQAAEAYLKKVGVTILKDMKVQSTVPEHAGITDSELNTSTTITLSDGRTISADIFIPAYGTMPNTRFAPSSILANDGRIKTNARTLRVDEAGPRVYALGDVSNAARPAVHAVLAQVPVLGKNIKSDFLLDSSAKSQAVPKDAEFEEDVRETQLVPIGKTKGVGAMMGWWIPSFLVWLIKGRDYWLWTTSRIWNGKQWA